MTAVLEERPAGVPAGAVWFPPADDFTALCLFNRSRPGGLSSRLRIAVPFTAAAIAGVLVDVEPRALLVNCRLRAEDRRLAWPDATRPVPGVWAWTLADEAGVQ